MSIHQVALAREQRKFRSSSQPPAELFITHGGGFTLSFFIADRQAGKFEYQCLYGLDRDSYPRLPFQKYTLYPLDQ